MNIFETYEHLIRFDLERMVSAGNLPPVDFARVSVEPPRDPELGDLVTNAALIASGGKDNGKMARVLAKHFISLHDVTRAEAAESGLVVLQLKPIVWQRAIIGVLHAGPPIDPCAGISYDAALDFTVSDRVFNVQYARTICCAVLRHAATALGRVLSNDVLAAARLETLKTAQEQSLMRKIIGWYHALRGGRRAIEVYLNELAGDLHALGKVQTGDAALGYVNRADTDTSLARLALLRAASIILSEATA